MANIVIRLPEMSREIAISEKWVAARDELLARSVEVKAVESQDDFDSAGELLSRVTKTSNQLEKMRKDFVKPLRNAEKAVKKAADQAREPLELEKERLKRLAAEYAEIQRQKAIEERQRLEAEERERVEKRIAEEQAAADLGLEPEPEPEIFEPEPEPEVKEARSSDVRVSTCITWNLVDEDALPRAFLSFDQKKLNQYICENGDLIRKRVEAKESSPVPGIEFGVITDVMARGR